MTRQQLCDWISEGKYDLKLAPLLIHRWDTVLKAHANDTLVDFFMILRRYFGDKYSDTEEWKRTATTDSLSIPLLARFIAENAELNFKFKHDYIKIIVG